MMQDMPTYTLTLNNVLLGSSLTAGSLEWLLLVVFGVAWLAFGVWLWRSLASQRPRLLLALLTMAGGGFATAIVAADALLFYSGAAVAGYATVALLLIAHHAGFVRSAALQVSLMVLGDLVLFELFLTLYSGAETADFTDLRTIYADMSGGLSFVSMLLVIAAGSKVAVLFLLVSVTERLPGWQAGAASGLLCVALVSGVLPVARLLDFPLSATAAGYKLLAISLTAILIWLLVLMCVLGKLRIDLAVHKVGVFSSRFPAAGFATLAHVQVLAQRLTRLFSEGEQRMLSSPVAVFAAAMLVLLLGLAFAGFQP